MKSRAGSGQKSSIALPAVLALWAAACAAGPPSTDVPDGAGGAGSGGRSGASAGSGGASAASGGSSGANSGGATGSGGAAGAGSGGAPGSGGATGAGGSGGGGSGAAGPGPDAAAETNSPVGPAMPPGPVNYGKVGELVLVPLAYTDAPVPPLVPPACPEDPTAGFSEYQDSFVVQRPRNLAAADRFKYENGIYTFTVQSSDQPHKAGNSTAPRTEARYSDISTGEHIWSADVMYESPSRTCVMQIHNVVGAIGVYLRVVGDRMFNLPTGKTIQTGMNGKWFNLKVYFNTQTREVKTYVNNCLKETSRAPTGTPYWYFKNGVYTCDSGTCRSNYKNIHLYQKGSTDKFHTKSTYP